MIAASDYESLYVANTDLGTVSVATLGGQATEIEVGAEPTRIARANDRVFVTLRGERAVAVLLETNGTLELETKIPVGAEPFGIVAREDGEKVYVANSMSKRIDEIDAEGLTVLRSWQVPVEPRWVALHPSNKTLYFASPYSQELFYIPLGDDDVIKSEAIPDGAFTGAFAGSARPFTPRVTGDMTVSSNGYEVVMPALYVDNTTPINDTTTIPVDGYYGSGRVNNPVAVVMPVDNNGEPMPEYAYLLQIGSAAVTGYPASVTLDPEGEIVYATMEGGGGVIATPKTLGSDGDILDQVFAEGSSGGGFVFNPTKAVTTAKGPRSIVFTSNDTAYTHAFLDNSVQDVGARALKDALNSGLATAFDRNSLNGGHRFSVAESTLDSAIERGRRLFYSNDNTKIAAAASGLSCATCHFDGRNDGLSWTFVKGLRQTPSLAGLVSATEPVRWEGDRETVQIDAMRTSADAMGGGNLSESELDDIAAYVDFIRDVDLARDELDANAVERGRLIFSRPDVACASCHSGARYTNNVSYDMFGLSSVQTRSLVGVASTAPYLHDGSAATLRDVLERSRDGSMGNTGNLTDQELKDLETFLRSL